MIKKFSLKKYLKSHKGIPKEEKYFVKLLDKVNHSGGRILRIMVEVYGILTNVPYHNKDVSNFMATIDEEQKHKDMSLLLAHFAKMKKEDPDFYYSDCLSFDTTYMKNQYAVCAIHMN